MQHTVRRRPLINKPQRYQENPEKSKKKAVSFDHIAVCDGVYDTPPGPIFHARYLRSWNSVGAKEVGVENISPRAFRRCIVQYLSTRFVVEQIELGETAPGVCCIHRSIYAVVLVFPLCDSCSPWMHATIRGAPLFFV